VKSALIQRVGGKHVSVTVESVDKYGRIVGSVTCEGRDIGEWMVREGLAIAAYHERYRQLEREARMGHTPTTSIPELTDTVSGEGLSNVSSPRDVQCQQVTGRF